MNFNATQWKPPAPPPMAHLLATPAPPEAPLLLTHYPPMTQPPPTLSHGLPPARPSHGSPPPHTFSQLTPPAYPLPVAHHPTTPLLLAWGLRPTCS